MKAELLENAKKMFFERLQPHDLNHSEASNILVIEDDPFSQKLFSYVLQSITSKHKIVLSNSFEDLESKYPLCNEIVLAIVDLNLEGKESGVDVINYLLSRNNRIPCFITSGLPENRIKSLLRGVDTEIPVLRKPFLPNQCKSIIESILLGTQ